MSCKGASTECTRHSILELSQPKQLHAEKINNREQAVWTTWTLFYSIWFSGLYHPLAEYLTQPRCLLQREVVRALKALSHLIVQANCSPVNTQPFTVEALPFFWPASEGKGGNVITQPFGSSWVPPERPFVGSSSQRERCSLLAACIWRWPHW